MSSGYLEVSDEDEFARPWFIMPANLTPSTALLKFFNLILYCWFFTSAYVKMYLFIWPWISAGLKLSISEWL
jgi:hypothetical protein